MRDLVLPLIGWLLITGTVCADDSDIRVAMAFSVSMKNTDPVPKKEPTRVENDHKHAHSYQECHALAIKTGKPLIVWTGQALCPD